MRVRRMGAGRGRGDGGQHEGDGGGMQPDMGKSKRLINGKTERRAIGVNAQNSVPVIKHNSQLA
jgi:hypothetical protein